MNSHDDAQERLKLGERLKDAREYLGLNQEEVATFLGIPRTALTGIESGQRKVDAIEFKKLAKLYKKPISHFTGDIVTAALPADIEHLARSASDLSVKDREELTKFAEYLHARSTTKAKK